MNDFKVRDLMITLLPETGCVVGGWTTRCWDMSHDPYCAFSEAVERPPGAEAAMVLCNGTVPPDRMTRSQLDVLRADLDYALRVVERALEAKDERQIKTEAQIKVKPLNTKKLLEAANVPRKPSERPPKRVAKKAKSAPKK